MALPLYHTIMRQELHGQIVQNGYWFTPREGVSPGLSDFNACAALNSWFFNFHLPMMRAFANDQLKFQGIITSTISPKNGPIAEQLLETSSGLQPDDSLPSYCAGLISNRTGFGGRSNRGRSYYAGVSEGDSADSKLSPDALSRLQSIGQQLLAHFGLSGSNPFFIYGVWSWKLGGTLTGSDYDVNHGFRPITQAIARINLATQRHRKIGIGT